MNWPYSLEECLRTIGHLVDELGLISPVIEEGDEEVTVREGSPGAMPSAHLRFTPEQLVTLVNEARARRGSGPASKATDHGERLRAVGRELDQRQARTVRLELANGAVAASYFRLGQGPANEAFSERYIRLLIDEGVRRRS